MTTDSVNNNRENTLSAGLIGSLPTDHNQLVPTPAEPGVINIDAVSDNQGTQTGTVDNFGFTDDLTPTLSGRVDPAAAGTVIQFCINTLPVGSAVVNSDGSWSFTPAQPLDVNHEYIFQTVVQDPGSKQFLISLPYTLYTTGANGDIPATATLDRVVDDVRGYHGFTGALKDGGLTNDAHPALSGHATVGSVVRIYDNGILLASTTAAADGSWQYTPSSALSDGVHNLAITATNITGESPPATFSIVVDTTVTKPVVDSATDNQGAITGNLAGGGVTDDSQPVLHGYAEPNSRVDIHVFGPNGNELYYQTVHSAADGTWSYQPKAFTAYGTYSFGISSVDAAGNAWYDYGTRFSLEYVAANQDDTTAPDAVTQLVLTDNVGSIQGAIHNQDITDDSTPTLTGRAEAGATVVVSDSGVVIGSTTVSADGRWSFTPSPVLKDGLHSFTTVVKDAAGQSSTVSDAIAFTVDTRTEKPVISGYHDDVGIQQGEVSYGGRTDDNNGLLSGHAEAGSLVKLTMVGPRGVKYGNVGSAIADSNGEWHIQLSDTTRLLGSGGNWTFRVTATDEAGNSATSDNFVVKYVGSNQDDLSAPDAPTIVDYTDNAGSSQGNLASGTVTDDVTPTLNGKAEAGSVVKIYEGSTLLGSTTASSSGDWHFTPAARSEGNHTFTANATDARGNTSPDSAGFVVKINPPDTTAPDAPLITAVYDDVGVVTGNVANGGKTDDAQVKVSGTAEANSIVTVWVKSPQGTDYKLGSVTTDGNGHWAYQMSGSQNINNIKGDWVFTARAADAAGNNSGISAGYTVESVASNHDDTVAPTITAVYDDVGVQTGVVANGGKTDDAIPTLSGTAEAGATVILRVTLPDYTGNSTFTLGSVVADINGHWHLDVQLPYSSPSISGSEFYHYVFTATAKDAAGNESAPSDGYAVNYVDSNHDDTSAPGAPTITSGYDDVGSSTGSFTSGATTDDTRPMLSGDAEANSIITVYEGSQKLGTAIANPGGLWAFIPPAELSEGKHTFTASATDAAGNTSAKSGGFVVNIDVPDTTPPGKPVITGVYDDTGVQTGNVKNGGLTDDSQPLISGTAEAGSTVVLYRKGPLGGNYLVGSAKADSNGHWEVQTQNNSGHLGNRGNYTYTATAKDAAGNNSVASDDYTVQFVASNHDDTLKPNAPTISNYYDNVGGSQGYDGNGGTTDDATPTLNGKAEANSIVKIYDGGTQIGSTTANGSGNWSFTSPARTEGKHTFSATATDAAGNTSEHSGNFVVNVDIPDYNFTETFNSQNQTLFSNSAVYHLQYFDVSVVNKGNSYYSPGFNGRHYGVSKPVSSTALVMGEGTRVTLDMKHALTDISFKIGDLTTDERLTIKYIDSHGTVIGTQVHTRAEGLLTTVNYHAPAGEDIASIQFSFTNPQYLYNSGMTYIWIDDITGHSSGVSPYALQMSTSYLEALPPAVHEAMAHDVTLATLPESNPAGVIELHNDSQNTLHLTLNDILSEAHDNLFIQDGKQQLAITGDKGDVVELKVEDLAHNEWQDAGKVTAGGVQYEVYQHADTHVELLVQQGVELHQVS